MKIEDIKNIKTQAEAKQFAIDWQSWSEGQRFYWSELAEWGSVFEKLAKKFDLVEEFKEEGII